MSISTLTSQSDTFKARGTGENGTYGAVVGDPLIYRLKKIYGAKLQGHAVQVGQESL